MPKQTTSQRFVFKVHTSRLRRADWNLKLTVKQARLNQELIAISDNQTLRFIDKINKMVNLEITISCIKEKIKQLKRDPNIKKTQREIKLLYEELDGLLFKPDYMCLVIDNNNDYDRACEGFKINDITYKRYLGTTGGVKNETIVFVNEDILPELKEKLANGRDLSKELVPAKFEAYQALVCSASTHVSAPKGVIVVNDCITEFNSDVIMLDDTHDSKSNEPKMQYVKDQRLELEESDGYGLGCPELMQRWSKDVGESYLLSGCVIRNSYCKGTVFCVDFHEFARKHNKTKIQDVWGDWHNIDNIQLVLTTSMVKLWDSYSSNQDYLDNCEQHGYSFAITKITDEELENERTMNYQFLQTYDFTDDELDELLQPTIDEINDVLGGDYRKAILYLKGVELNEYNVQHLDDNFSTALMIDKNMIQDPFIQKQIYSMIRKRIDNAKVGAINVNANYSLVSGDPYSLCQHIFGLEVTGLLKSGEAYSRYWNDREVNEVVCYRAPMTCHNNIRVLKIANSKKMQEFYQYMTTITIFNSWDTAAHALNGLDKDGDTVFTTDNKILLKNTKRLPAIVCQQRNAKKSIPTEENLILANKNSFGNEIGSITNKITSMKEVQSNFPHDSREYRMLEYRIQCGQLYQQNAIDKTKGIEANPMPAEWCSWDANKFKESDTSKDKKRKWFNRRILADKKPYFMMYVYPDLKGKYNNYINKTNEKCVMEFRVTIDELLQKKDLTDKEKNFIKYYYIKMPVGRGDCTINRICWRFEKLFDDRVKSNNVEHNFDYSVLKSDTDYNQNTFIEISKLYKQYNTKLQQYKIKSKKERIKPADSKLMKYLITDTFAKMCYMICPNEDELCNIVLDLCYTNNKTKQFAWDMCGDVFIKNLLRKNNNTIHYPTKEPHGGIIFGGERFKMKNYIVENGEGEGIDIDSAE